MKDTLELTVDLRKMRDTAKKIAGEHYEEKIMPYRDAIQRWHKESGEPLVKVCLVCCQQAERHGNEYQVLLAIAASVEEMEAAEVCGESGPI